MKSRQMSVRKLTQMAMLAAIGVVLVYLIHVPIFPAVPFLEYDPGDIPLILTSCLFGPLPALLLTLVVSVVQGLTVSAQSGVGGILMHFLATGGYVLVSGLIFYKRKNVKRAVAAMVSGTLTMCVLMVFLNLTLTPVFQGLAVQAVIELMPFIIAFNLIKAGINSILAFVIFKYVGPAMLRQVES